MASKVDVNRWQQMQDIGCIFCALDGRLQVPGDIHHVLSGGRRISDRHTICCCPWHHRGVPPTEGMTIAEATKRFGPSIAHNQKATRERYGSEKELLEIQEALLTKYREEIGQC